MRSQAGLTLLEILAATLLMALVMVAVTGWVRLLGRTSASIAGLETAERAQSAVVRLLRADLTGMISHSWYVDQGGTGVQFSSINSLPGQPPAIQAIHWHDGEQGLVRESRIQEDRPAPAPSAAVTPPPPATTVFPNSRSGWRFVTDPPGVLWLVRTEAGASDSMERILVWQAWSS